LSITKELLEIVMKSPAVRPSHFKSPLSGARLELLESRCLLTSKLPAQITIQEVPSPLIPGTTELLITGTKKNDGISISDNGTGTAGNMFVSLSNGEDYMSTGAVTSVDVATGTGSDRVTYELDGNLQTPNQELVFVGSGVKKGGGAVQLTVNIVGSILDGSQLVVLAQPDPKKPTTMTVNDSGEIDGQFTTGISAVGQTKLKPGPENFSLQSTAKVGPNGILDMGAVGGSHNDVAKITYSGTNDGQIDVTELGNGGSDQLSADIFMTAGSTGSVGAANNESEIEGSGKDRLSFTVEQGTDTTSTTNIFAEVIGTTKKDKVVHTANVFVKTKGTVTLVS
jgi:hypothetical protein